MAGRVVPSFDMTSEAEESKACKDCLMLREEFSKNPGKKVEISNKAVALVVVGLTGSPAFIIAGGAPRGQNVSQYVIKGTNLNQHHT